MANTDNEQAICWQINDLTRLMTNEFNRRLRLAGFTLSRAQARILIRLARRDGQCQSELAQSLGMEKAPLGVIIDKMDKANLIERREDPNDRRRRAVYTTTKAKQLLPDINQLTEQLAQQATAGLNQAERQLLAKTLNHITLNLLSTH